MQEDVLTAGAAWGDLDAPPAHHRPMLVGQAAVDNRPVLAGREELLARPADRRQHRVGRQERAAEHAPAAVVCPDRPVAHGRLVRRVDEPLLAVLRLRGHDTVANDEMVRQEEDKLAGCQGALLAQVGLPAAAHRAVLVAGRRVAGHIDELIAGVECLELGAELLVLPAMVAFHRAAPISCRRLAGLVNEHAIMGHGLGVIVGQVLAVLDLLIAGARVERQKAAMVDDEVQRVEMPVLREDPAASEEAVRVVRSSAGPHEHLAHGLEMPGPRQALGGQRRGRRLQARKEKGIDEPTRRVAPGRQHVLDVPCEGGRLRDRPAVQVPDVGQVRIHLPERQLVRRVRRVAEAELQRSRPGSDPIPGHVVGEPGAVGPTRRDVLSGAGEPGVEEVLLRPRVGAEDVAERGRGPAPVVAARPPAVLEHAKVLVVPPDQPAVDALRLDARAGTRAAEKPQAVPHPVEARVVAGHVLAVDRGSGLEHVVDRLDQPREQVGARGLVEVVVEPIPSTDGVDSGRGVPVHSLAVAVALLVEPQAGVQAPLRQGKVSLVLGDEEHERGLGRRRTEFSRGCLRPRAQLGQQPIDALLRARVPSVLRPQGAAADLRPRVGVEE